MKKAILGEGTEKGRQGQAGSPVLALSLAEKTHKVAKTLPTTPYSPGSLLMAAWRMQTLVLCEREN